MYSVEIHFVDILGELLLLKLRLLNVLIISYVIIIIIRILIRYFNALHLYSIVVYNPSFIDTMYSFKNRNLR